MVDDVTACTARRHRHCGLVGGPLGPQLEVRVQSRAEGTRLVLSTQAFVLREIQEQLLNPLQGLITAC